MKLIILLLLLLICLGVWETARHRWFLRQIPVRVHVNGSRGKSSVSRLIAAGLRGGDLRVVAKTTGSAAAVIHTDGSETPVVRRGGPNIREQLRVIRDAAREGCDALVIECNHDVDMLLEGPYPMRLKERARGQLGHLNNGQAGALAAGVDG